MPDDKYKKKYRFTKRRRRHAARKSVFQDRSIDAVSDGNVAKDDSERLLKGKLGFATCHSRNKKYR